MRKPRLPDPRDRGAAARISVWFTLLLLLLQTGTLIGQSTDSPSGLPKPAPQQISVGDSFVTLAGPWKFAPGDSPGNDDGLVWANPSFDDAQWSTMDLHARPGELDPAYGSPGYLTGWTARGYPRLAGYAWYRLRVHVADAKQPLAIKMPDHVDDAYQVFVNGSLIGSFGVFRPGSVICFRARPLIFPLPAPDAHGDMLLAIRFYLEPSVLVFGTTPDGGGMHQAPLIGMPSALEYVRANEVRGRILSVIVWVFVSFMMLIAAAGAFWLWLLDRRQPAYLWLTLALLCPCIDVVTTLTGQFTFLSRQEFQVVLSVFLRNLELVFWILFWWKWFKLRTGRLINTILMSGMLINTSTQIFILFFSAHVSVASLIDVAVFGSTCGFLLVLLVVIPPYKGFSRDRMGALIAVPPIFLLILSTFNRELLLWFRIQTAFFPFGIQVDVKNMAFVVLLLVVGALVARRFIQSQVSQRLERQSVDQELEQARELQQHVLIPEPVHSDFYTVETAYLPARTVGGDFFQVVPRADGSLLIVVGDVSGKGIAAAMLVAVLVGAVRTRADETFDPAAILHTLNERLLGRAGGHFATCIAAHLLPDGTVRIANAGHLSPYIDGRDLEMSGSLPLGMLAGATYETADFHLHPGEQLTIMTDGVVEAQRASGELYGFTRTREISRQSADAIVETAQQFGQSDDITAVTVVMVGSPVAAVA